jgi:hypothetical protein
MLMKTKPTAHKRPTPANLLAAERERKRRERARQRSAGLVETRLRGTRAQREKLLGLLEREGLSILRTPQKAVLSMPKSEPTAPDASRAPRRIKDKVGKRVRKETPGQLSLL